MALCESKIDLLCTLYGSFPKPVRAFALDRKSASEQDPDEKIEVNKDGLRVSIDFASADPEVVQDLVDQLKARTADN